MTVEMKDGVIPVRPTYTSLFRRGRVLGHLLARPGFSWETEPMKVARGTDWMIHQSCNAAFTPFIADIAQQALALVGQNVPVIGGSESCCGELNFHFGDEDLGDMAARKAQQAFLVARTKTIVSVCPDCDAIFEAKPIPNRRYQSANVSQLIVDTLPALRPMMKPVGRRVVIHTHDDSDLTRKDAACVLQILEAIPGLEILPSRHAHGPGRHCQVLKPMPKAAQTLMFEEARNLGADGIVVAYHSCYRQHLKFEIGYGVATHHYMALLGESLGLQVHEEVKRLRLMDDLDKVTNILLERATGPNINFDTLKEIVSKTIFC